MSNTVQEKKGLTGKQKTLLRTIALAVLSVVVICGVLLSAWSIRNEHLRDKLFFVYSGNPYDQGVYPIQMDVAAQQKEVKKNKRHGQTGKFQYYYTPIVQMQAYYAESTIFFGNVSTNNCALVFSIFDENDEQIYRSVGITPGNYVHAIRLPDPKEKGSYACRLYVAAYDLETNAYLGAQYSDLTLIIGG